MPHLHERYKGDIDVRGKEGQYIKIATEDFMLIDQMRYLPNKCSLDQFLYDTLGRRAKGKFPYEWMDDLSKLEATELPLYEHWYSELRQQNVLDSEWKLYQGYLREGCTADQAMQNMGLLEPPKPGREVLRDLNVFYMEMGFRTFRDFVAYYLALDVEPMGIACDKMSRIFLREFGVNIYRSFVSLPGVAIKVGMEYLRKKPVYIPSEKVYKLLNTVPAGQSILFNLEAHAGTSVIRKAEFGEHALPVKSIFSMDSTLMYGHCMSDIPYGIEVIYESCDGFVAKYSHPSYNHYRTATTILAYISWEKNLDMKTYLDWGEGRSGLAPNQYQVDGEVLLDDGMGNIRKIAFEVYGHGGHCCPICVYPPEKIHPVRKIPYAEVEKLDRKRITALLRDEYDEINIVHVCEFTRDYTATDGIHHAEYAEFLRQNPDQKLSGRRHTEVQMMEKIKSGEIRGFLRADINTPPGLRKITEAFPLVFKKALLERHHGGPIIQEFLENLNLHKRPTLELISVHSGEQLFISSKLACYYMDLGAEIKNLTIVVRYKYTDKLKPFVQRASDLRYSATNSDEKLLGNQQKSLVNSMYGRTMVNPANYTNVTFVDSDSVVKSIYKGLFVGIEYVGKVKKQRGELKELYEVKKRPKTLTYSSPKQIAAEILCNSKLHMLRLVYDVIVPNFYPQSYSFFASMTDSLSIICSEETMEDWFRNCVLPERREGLDGIRDQWFARAGDDGESRRSRYQAGIFKKEWDGTVVVGVSSKCYIVSKNDKIVKLHSS